MRKFLVGLLMVPCIAHAEFWTGNKLLTHMQGSNIDQIQAYGYLMGVFDTAAGVDHCGHTSANVTVGQINDIAKQYLEQNPAIRNWTADLLVRMAFGRAWPCPKSNNKGGKGV